MQLFILLGPLENMNQDIQVCSGLIWSLFVLKKAAFRGRMVTLTGMCLLQDV